MDMKNGRIRNGAPGRVASGTRVIGIGGAGWHMLRAVAARHAEGMSLAEVNTDLRASEVLEGVARHPIGGKVTRGLGAGGDPEVGARAAEESAEAIGDAVGDCATAVLMLGLGGGTGTGAAPAIAAEAKRRGARVVALCALPFEFEGRRRAEQAGRGLEALRAACDVVFAFENDLLARALPEESGVEEAFGLCSEMLARMAVGMHRALVCRGIMDLDPADLARVVGSKGCRIGWAEGSGEHRVNEALDRLADSPLLGGAESGRPWDIVVQVTGGPEMSLSDVQKVTRRIRRQFGEEDVSVTLGALVETAMRGRIDILLGAAESRAVGDGLGAAAKEVRENPGPVERPHRNGTSRVPHVKAVRQIVPPPPPPPPPPAPSMDAGIGEMAGLAAAGDGDAADEDQGNLDPGEAEAMAELAMEGSSGEPVLDEPTAAPGDEAAEAMGAESGDGLFSMDNGEEEGGDDVRFGGSSAAGRGMVQGALNFESPSRGRFDKTEVTMYKGENLDIPTFMRRRLRITTVE
ncbi:MAG: hypothetical protein IT577_17840 [Verrucomicrobiae bacterium]|nr:hypothetical protein [Verrucomicrobiae bacterium]